MAASDSSLRLTGVVLSGFYLFSNEKHVVSCIAKNTDKTTKTYKTTG